MIPYNKGETISVNVDNLRFDVRMMYASEQIEYLEKLEEKQRKPSRRGVLDLAYWLMNRVLISTSFTEVVRDGDGNLDRKFIEGFRLGDFMEIISKISAAGRLSEEEKKSSEQQVQPTTD